MCLRTRPKRTDKHILPDKDSIGVVVLYLFLGGVLGQVVVQGLAFRGLWFDISSPPSWAYD